MLFDIPERLNWTENPYKFLIISESEVISWVISFLLFFLTSPFIFFQKITLLSNGLSHDCQGQGNYSVVSYHLTAVSPSTNSTKNSGELSFLHFVTHLIFHTLRTRTLLYYGVRRKKKNVWWRCIIGFQKFLVKL